MGRFSGLRRPGMGLAANGSTRLRPARRLQPFLQTAARTGISRPNRPDAGVKDRQRAVSILGAVSGAGQVAGEGTEPPRTECHREPAPPRHTGRSVSQPPPPPPVTSGLRCTASEWVTYEQACSADFTKRIFRFLTRIH